MVSDVLLMLVMLGKDVPIQSKTVVIMMPVHLTLVILLLVDVFIHQLHVTIITPVLPKSVILKSDVSFLLFVAVIKTRVLPTPVIRKPVVSMNQLIVMMVMSVLLMNVIP
jgi:hypothetical protein